MAYDCGKSRSEDATKAARKDVGAVKEGAANLKTG
jgi:hypothetical protein